MKIRLSVYDKRIAVTKLELNALALQIGDVREKTHLAKVLKERIYWSDALKEIGNRVSEQIRLTEIRAQENRLILKGEIKSADLAEEKILTQFMNSLGKGIFKQVELVTSKKGISSDKPYTFELKLSVE